MATFTTAPANWTNVTNDANFRAWGLYISNQMTAVGLTKTADTGQIDWTTVLNPGSPNTYAGYEIRIFTDALQGSAPVFFKIEYGEGDATDSPGVRVQFGSGSNGTGTLTGSLSGQYLAQCASVTAANSVFGSGSTARFVMCGGFIIASSSFGMWFGFERTKDSSGADTTEGVLWMSHNSASSTAAVAVKTVSVWSTTLGVLLTSTTLVPALFPINNTGASGAQTMFYPIMHSKGVFMNPGLNFLGYLTENTTVNSTPSVYMYGTSHTYYALPATSACTGAAYQGPGAGTEALAIRYE